MERRSSNIYLSTLFVSLPCQQERYQMISGDVAIN